MEEIEGGPNDQLFDSPGQPKDKMSEEVKDCPATEEEVVRHLAKPTLHVLIKETRRKSRQVINQDNVPPGRTRWQEIHPTGGSKFLAQKEKRNPLSGPLGEDEDGPAIKRKSATSSNAKDLPHHILITETRRKPF